MAKDDRFDPRFDPAFQPGYDGPVSAARRAPEPAIGLPPTAEPASMIPVPPVMEPDDPASRRPNPFLIALGAASILLIASGIVLITRVRSLFVETQANPDFDYVTLQVLIFAAPMLLVLGIATAIGVLFLFAVRWNRG